jgi:glycosyltransferase involved in cell wall biosynthesis
MHSIFTINWESKPTVEDFERYLSKERPDKILLIETPLNWNFLSLLNELSIPIVFIPMNDSVGLGRIKRIKDEHNISIDKFVCLTRWAYEIAQSYNLPSVYCPFPVDTEKFKFTQRGSDNIVFLHNAGKLGNKFRKGTDLVVSAYWQSIINRNSFNLLLRSQYAKDVDNPYELYSMGDVYLAPSRKEGLGLPIYEAMACGLPVITTDFMPASEPIPFKELLINNTNIPIDNDYKDGSEHEISMDHFLDTISMVKNLGKDRIQEISCGVRKHIYDNYSWDSVGDRLRREIE